MGKSHFQIDEAIVSTIRLLAKKGSTIVEIGSGTGTKILSSEYIVYSVEDNEEWVGHCEKANYIHAPLIELESNRRLKWYDPDILRKSLPEQYSLLLVDGPFGENGRDGLLTHLDIFDSEIPIVIDDTLRSHECRIAREMAYLLNRPLYVFWNFSIIVPKLLSRKTLARIQTYALQNLENEDEQYLKRYLHRKAPLLPIDTAAWKQIERNSRSDKKRIEMIESSFTWRIGRMITRPLWPIHKLRSMVRKKRR